MRDIRETLNRFPSESFGGNGRHFLGSCFHDDALAYAVIQVMRPSLRSDPAHFDGVASMRHAGLTVWGRRSLEIRLARLQGAPLEWQKFPQEPGSFYIGNLRAPWHQVAHLPAKQADPLHRSSDSDEGVHIAALRRVRRGPGPLQFVEGKPGGGLRRCQRHRRQEPCHQEVAPP